MRVLLIKDDCANRRHIELSLRGEDICAESIETGEDGIQCARHSDYDAIVLDLGLPDISGLEVLRALRRARIDTPVIMISVVAAPQSKIKALNAGADDYVTLPCNDGELIARLRAVVRRSKGISDSRVSFGPMTIDLIAKTVEAQGQRVPLSGKEYLILELLSLRRGKPVSKETMINHIYTDGEGPNSPTIGLFMHRLRKKLAAASGGRRYIETVQQHGYLLPQSA
jgi:two-component system, cell cycle response regulator CtrA